MPRFESDSYFRRSLPPKLNSDMTSTASTRKALIIEKFPQGIPRLWCPTLTHFSAAAQPAPRRIRQHYQALSPYVKGILVPGSTGEGWEMSDADVRGLLELTLDAASQFGMHALIGVLKTDGEAVLSSLNSLRSFQSHPAVVGFTICPPKGSQLSQPTIRESVQRALDVGLPTALYQLPQVTENEMTSDTVMALAENYPHFFLFKDTSGDDRVALSGVDSSVFMVRGSEKGGYAPWLRDSGGPYDGFLLSTANVFARELSTIMQFLSEGRRAEAEALSERLQSTVGAAFELVSRIPAGNPFANANKLLDHIMAYGSDAVNREPPLLFSGFRLPQSLVAQVLVSLEANGLLPKNGYLEND